MFVPGEGGIAADDKHEWSEMVPLDGDIQEGGFSSAVIDFDEEPATLAVPRMVGCTSIIVVSRKGAWASHIWEEGVFEPKRDPKGRWILPEKKFYEDGQDEFPFEKQLAHFKTHALYRLHTTYPDTPEAHHESGLKELRENDEMFEDKYEPHVFMFIPYKRVGERDPNYNRENPVGLPAAWDHGGNPSPRGDDGVESYNDQIRAELKKIFGEGLDIKTVLYAPDPDHTNEDIGFDNPRGRALVQYQPGDGNDCDNSKARWRVFFERQTTPHTEDEWKPAKYQYCLPPNDARRLMRRQDEVCKPEEEPEEEEPEEEEPEEEEPEEEEPEEEDPGDIDTDVACGEPGAPWCVDVWGPRGSR